MTATSHRPPAPRRDLGLRAGPSPALAALAACGLAALAACGGGADGAQERPVTVKILYDYGGKGDRAFSDSAYAGLVRVGEEHALVVEEATSIPDGDYVARKLEGWLSLAPPKGEELVINLVSDESQLAPLRPADCDLGGRHVLQFFAALPECPTVRSVAFRTYAPAYLAGVAAAQKSANGTMKVAIIGDSATSLVQEAEAGFKQGVEDTNANIEVLDTVYLADATYVGTVAEQGYDCAKELYEIKGVDVIFPMAGTVAFGVIEAAKETGDATDSPPRFTFGFASDQTSLGQQVVLGSVLTRLDLVVRDVVREVAEGRFEAGTRTYSLGDDSGYVDFTVNPRFEFEISCACQSQVEKALAAQQVYVEAQR